MTRAWVSLTLITIILLGGDALAGIVTGLIIGVRVAQTWAHVTQAALLLGL